MNAVVLTIHSMIVLALVGVVLLQRSEGGAAGMLGGGGGGGLMSGRGAATALTRSTTILAGLFFTSSLTLALIADRGDSDADFLPIDTEERSLEDEDFSDIIGSGDDEEAPEAAVDPFALPEGLGTGEDTPEEEEPPQQD
ncbi:MAG: preprotein translocase subunit SecG [Pseudomonadota bacterium]